MKKYLVGGAVRDIIRGIEPNDLDYVIVGSTIDEMIAKGYKQVGKEFPVFLDEDGNELALARKDYKTGDKHTDFEFDFSADVTLVEDLKRRDLTVNAIAMDDDNQIIDPFDGIEDINNRLLRIVDKEHFKDDALRLFRVARFSSQLCYEVETNTMKLLKEMVVEGSINHLTAERVWKETEKALASGFDTVRYFETLNECGALEVWFPELFKLTTTPERLDYHPSGNSFKHTMIALDRVKYESAIVKFAVLVHDLGKGTTPVDILPSHHLHEVRGPDLINDLCNRLKVPNDFRDFAIDFCKVHMRMHKTLTMRLSKQYELAKSISNRFKNRAKMEAIFKAFFADHFGEDIYFSDELRDVKMIEYNSVVNSLANIYNIMEGVTLNDLSEKAQEKLAKLSGEKFGKAYNEYLYQYLEKRVK